MSEAPDRCIVCGSAARPRCRRDHFRIEACPACGLQWRDPFPDAAELEALYAEAYFERWGAEDPRRRARVRTMKQASYAHFLDALTGIRRGGSLLDVGCAYGYLLAVAGERGFDAWGVELNPAAAAAAAAEFGARIHAGGLDAAAFPGRRFDVLTAVDVLEHVADPGAFLAAARERLASAGHLLAVLPNAASLTARLWARRWPHYAGEHLFHWTPAALRRFLDERGFRVRVLRTGLRKTFSLHYLTSYADHVGAWLPQGLRSVPDWRVRIPTGEMLVVAERSD